MGAIRVPPDDISALLSRVELDRSQYKVFERRLGGQNDAGVFPRLAIHTAAKTHTRVNSPAADSAAHVSQASHPRWNVLNSLISVEHTAHATATEELLIPMLTFSADSGGVGKTTILTTLASILSSMGESIFLAFSDSQCTLPMHFGGQQVVSGRIRTLIPPKRDFGELHLYACSQEECGSDQNVDWLPRQVNPLVAEVGRVLCEITNSEMPQRQTRELGTINLRVLVPDISSVLAVTRDLAALENEPDSERSFYLLNKFDSSVPFHRDLRDRLSAVLGERLLPFAIRRTDQLAEALAAGVTIMDYAPEAPVLGDFKLLAEWLRNSMHRNEIEPARRLI